MQEARPGEVEGDGLLVEGQQDRVDVVGRGGIGVLGRSAVVDAEHRHARLQRQVATDQVVDVDVVHHEAAAVQVHHDAPVPRAGVAAEQPDPHPAEQEVTHLVDVGARLLEIGQAGALPLGHDVVRRVVHRPLARRRLDRGPCLRVQHQLKSRSLLRLRLSS